jgi:hypothetical protein
MAKRRFKAIKQTVIRPNKSHDLNLRRNATEYTNNHEYKDAAEIILHFINIKELKFVYKHNGNKLARTLVAYL